MSGSGAAIAVSGLTKSFGPTKAVNDLTFDTEPGEIFGLVGPDGAGKTTVMRMLAAVLAPDRGTIRIDGVDVVAEPETAKSHVSYMPKRFGLYEDLTVDENIRFFADLFGIGRADREARAASLLASSDLVPFRRRLAGKLSGGMKQKLGLVCALIHAPRILLLDEPTAGVDPVSRRDFWRLLYQLIGDKVSIVYSTSYLDEAERCTRLALIDHGTLIRCDTPKMLKEKMPGAIIEVISRQGRAVRDAGQKAAGVASALVVGDGVHFAVDDAAARMPAIAAALAAAGLAYEKIEAITPTIEDVFVSLVNRDASA